MVRVRVRARVRVRIRIRIRDLAITFRKKTGAVMDMSFRKKKFAGGPAANL